MFTHPFLYTSSQSCNDELTLNSVTLEISGIDTIYKVTYIQNYTNDTKFSVEAQFVFPILDSEMKIHEIVVQKEAEIFKAKMLMLENHKAIIEKAKEKFVKEQEIYKIEKSDQHINFPIGNIKPNEKISIIISYVNKAKYDINNKEWIIKIPQKYIDIGPRTFPVKFNINIEASQLNKISNPKWTDVSKGSLKADKNEISGKLKINKSLNVYSDFCLRYQIDLTEPSVNIVESLENNHFALDLLILPKIPIEKPSKSNKIKSQYFKGEYVFFLDISASMSGSRIQVAKNTLKIFLKSLPRESKFNVYFFNDFFESVFMKSVDYMESNIEQAMNKIENVLPKNTTYPSHALTDFFKNVADKKYPRNIFILTDGQFFDSLPVLGIIKNNAETCKTHIIGIANANETYIDNLAKTGNGKSVYIQNTTNEEMITSSVIEMLNKSSSANLSNIKIEWPKTSKVIEFSYPNSVCFGYSLHIHALFSNQPKGIMKISAQNSQNGKPVNFNIDLSKHAQKINREFMNILCASEILKNNTLDAEKYTEIVENYNILNEKTDFILVDSNEFNIDNYFPAILPIETIPKNIVEENKIKDYGDPIIKDMIKLQDSGELLIPKRNFKRLINEISDELMNDQNLKKKKIVNGIIPIKIIPSEPKRRIKLQNSLLKSKQNRKNASKIMRNPIFTGTKEDFEKIVQTQNINGFWDICPEILGLTKFNTAKEFFKEMPKKIKKLTKKDSKIIWATLIVIWCLITKYEHRSGSCLMILTKAKEWLGAFGINFEDFQNEAKNCLKS